MRSGTNSAMDLIGDRRKYGRADPMSDQTSRGTTQFLVCQNLVMLQDSLITSPRYCRGFFDLCAFALRRAQYSAQASGCDR